MSNSKNIIDKIILHGLADMETDSDILTIVHKKFYTTKKEFLFMLNSKAIYDCKTRVTAEKKIQSFIDKGFKLEED